ncbi:glycosyltransferase family 1 protein [Sphingomonas suaedae]|uniref:Glycosyltransferase family 1 protein n=1 Tax=Sphingomonas suaedae TaxID=2599297 RepID=A0A518RH51_9SPHN|nr:glycosyltransferase [Sphingomonas suaedae]QDX26760.1 glycosyltransferase family 1 protein [Sphingomonas suaedae]
MKIVDVCAFYSPRGGGVKTYVGQKLALAERMGQDITILAPADQDIVVEFGPCARIQTIASPRFPLDRKYWYFGDERALHAALDKLAPDFVEASSPWRSPLMVANWRPEIPKALIMHADPLSAYAYRWLEPIVSRETIDRRFARYWDHLRQLGRLYDAVVCASENLSSRMKAGGVANVVTVPMGVEPRLFSARRRDPDLRASLLAECGLGTDATLLVAAGRLAPEKRLPMLVEAVTIAGRHRELGLAIFGEGRDDMHILRSIGGNPHIRLFRPERDRERFASILASADAFLHGCEAETFCMTAAEASASGIPVIVPDRGGAADFAKDRIELAYRAADPGDLVRAILALPGSFAVRPSDRTVRAMDDHFAALFGMYRNLTLGGLSSAA